MNRYLDFNQYKVTSSLLVINIVVFILMSLTGGSQDTANLVRFGANVKGLVYAGEYYRLLTASFLHIGIFHLAFNMYFLYSIGPAFERLYGSRNFAIIYILAGIMGNLMTLAFGDIFTVSAGASTSLYGLMGLGLGLMLNYRNDHFLSSFGASFFSLVAINIVYSILSPSIGIWGHLGGLIGGIILSGTFPVLGRSLDKGTVTFSIVAYLALVVIFYGIGLRSLKL